MKTVNVLIGIVCGAFVGFTLGVVAAISLGYLSKWSNPNDPSAGSIAILVIATAPFGALVGATLGGVTISSQPRLFRLTFLPLAILFLALLGTLSTLEGMDRPRNFVLVVDGTQGAEYFGVVSVDGATKNLKGKLPAKFEYTGFRVEMKFALVNANEKDSIFVKALANGNNLGTETESQTGIQLELESFGYSETFGGTSNQWSRLSQAEVDQLLTNRVVPGGL